jgi:lipoate-protein ligase A
MAIDQALLEAVEAGGLPALRFYYWEPPCLSLGRNQPARGIYDTAAAAARGIDIVRRPTGGRAVLHDRELTYCVVVRVGELGPPRETYAAINRALVAGLRRLGVPALVVPAPAAAPAQPAWQEALGASPCFDVAAPGEVVAEGRKLIGSAQRRDGGVLLQHGSLLLDGDQAAVVELRLDPGPIPPALLPRPATLRELLGEAPPRAALEQALAAGFEEALGIRLAPAALSGAEMQAAARWRAHFESEAWTWRR